MAWRKAPAFDATRGGPAAPPAYTKTTLPSRVEGGVLVASVSSGTSWSQALRSFQSDSEQVSGVAVAPLGSAVAISARTSRAVASSQRVTSGRPKPSARFSSLSPAVPSSACDRSWYVRTTVGTMARTLTRRVARRTPACSPSASAPCSRRSARQETTTTKRSQCAMRQAEPAAFGRAGPPSSAPSHRLRRWSRAIATTLA
mmetsp:Transcript_52466/g.114797  ORF Transcript_52466/g.114797 Transcript_52466/m.114797 type:complete len:201 (+) Transcript_52466:154-756(+)